MVKNLRLLRDRAGISQQKLGEAVGVSQQTINKYENHDTEPDIYTLAALADYFHTSVDYLIGHTDIDHVIEAVQPYDLNEDEGQLVELYRKLTEKKKQSIRLILEEYS